MAAEKIFKVLVEIGGTRLGAEGLSGVTFVSGVYPKLEPLRDAQGLIKASHTVNVEYVVPAFVQKFGPPVEIVDRQGKRLECNAHPSVVVVWTLASTTLARGVSEDTIVAYNRRTNNAEAVPLAQYDDSFKL